MASTMKSKYYSR